ncbi:MAG: CHAT domain-containing protein [Gemmatimonadota bacterium]|nr:MAG: CHAT domain-containing protein [Gemmatimonadota bacterium]
MIALLCACVATGLVPPQSVEEVEEIRALAESRDESRLEASVADRPNEAREALHQVLKDLAVETDAGRQGELLAAADGIAQAYATAWSDSFLLRSVQRFAAWTPDERRRKAKADSLRRAGNDAFRREGLQGALSRYRESMHLARTVQDTSGVARSLGNIGAAYRSAGKYDSSVAVLWEAHRLALAAGDLRTAANARSNLANLSYDRFDLAQAFELYLDALRLRERAGDESGQASDRHNLGLVYRELGDPLNARRQLQAAYEIHRRHGSASGAADALVELAEIHVDAGAYAAAADALEAAREVYAEQSDEAGLALVGHRSGRLQVRRGAYREAEGLLQASLHRYESLERVVSAVGVCLDLARAYMAIGDLEAAREVLGRAERLNRGGGSETLVLADIALARGDLFVYLNEPEAASVHYEVAAAGYREASDEVRYREAASASASLLLLKEEYEAAARSLQGILASQLGEADPRSVAHIRLQLAYAQERAGDVGRALENLEAAKDAFDAIGDVVGRATTLGSLGDLERRRGAAGAARPYYQAGLRSLAALQAPDVAWRLHFGLGEIHRREGDLDTAQSHFRAAIDQIEDAGYAMSGPGDREAFLFDKWEAYAALAGTQLQRGKPEDAFQTSERMRARSMLATLERGNVRINPVAAAPLAEREQDLRRHIHDLSRTSAPRNQSVLQREAPSPDPDGLERARLQDARSVYDNLLQSLAVVYPDNPRIIAGRHASWPEVAKNLDDETALIEYLVSDSTTLAFLVTSDTLVAVDLGFARRPLAALVEFARGALVGASGTSAEAWRTPLARLYERLFAPLEDTALLGSKRRLLIAPHDVLHYVPFHALITESDGEFLTERYSIAYAPSASIWLRLRKVVWAGPDKRILALAPNLDGLPGTRDEIRSIVRLYGREATILTGSAASEARLKATAREYPVIHLGTAGHLNKQNPLFSHVVLRPGDGEDGYLEVHEVFGLELDGQLVVLSACETALASGTRADVPTGDDWISLSRAFLTAGASSVLATLWRIDDRSAAAFTRNFYRWLRDGVTLEEALREAQLALLRDPATADPYHWAAFALIGGS